VRISSCACTLGNIKEKARICQQMTRLWTGTVAKPERGNPNILKVLGLISRLGTIS